MKVLDLTLSSPELNLALDEALLDGAENSPKPTEVLRLWESPTQMVVMGRASKVAEEVDVNECRHAGIPILRRCSGGTSIVAGPGCLMYAVVLDYELHPELRIVEQAHRFVMERMQLALSMLDPRVEYRGSCDLAIEERKISGNSLRCKRRHLLYHGTVLYDFPLEIIEHLLGTPPRQSAYRAGRNHSAFVTNLPHPVSKIRQAICSGWNADEQIEVWPQAATELLVTTQYSQESWNLRR